MADTLFSSRIIISMPRAAADYALRQLRLILMLPAPRQPLSYEGHSYDALIAD